MEIEKGKWYMIYQYGVDFNIKGRVVDVCEEFVTLKFYSVLPFIRTREVVHISQLVGECEKPPVFRNK